MDIVRAPDVTPDANVNHVTRRSRRESRHVVHVKRQGLLTTTLGVLAHNNTAERTPRM